MNTNTVQDAINKRAEIRFQQDFTNAIRALRANPILNRLKISVRLPDGAEINPLYLVATGSHDLFRDWNNYLTITDGLKKTTNFLEIKEQLLQEYIASETGALFSKIDEINAFFEEQKTQQYEDY
jgi:hypothetical protein